MMENRWESEEEDTSADERQQHERLIKARTPQNKYRNKQRTLVVCSRGIGARERHLMNDLIDLIPHSRKDCKVDCKKELNIIPEMATMKNCNNVVYFELKNRKDLFMWLAKNRRGPTVKFHITNVHTMAELKLTGNCLKGSRPIISFDSSFDDSVAQPHIRLFKEMFIQIFGSPKAHPKTKPFHDHIFQFSLADGKIWFRHFQIVYDADPDVSLKEARKSDPVLVEIGPRFVMVPIKILSGCFSGATLYQNPSYKTPHKQRALRKEEFGSKYTEKVQAQAKRKARVAATEVVDNTDFNYLFQKEE